MQARRAWPAVRRAALQRSARGRVCPLSSGAHGALERYYPAGVANERATMRRPHGLAPGDVVHGFRVETIQSVPEYGADVIKLRHERTGADYVHIDTAETCNVFCISFRTPPTDSTGVPHILEHTTLCGSEKFPVRDPFFAMMKRSLNSFMNALTGPVHTMYPFSTQVPADFVNLATVYADAVFHPHLREVDFLQEGHRFQLGPGGDLELAGVVLNEMKGTLGDRDALWMTHVNRVTLPGSSFAHEFGGHPGEIPRLTHASLVAFHRRHYHPSNALLFTYGDLPVRSHLAFADAEILAPFEASPEAAAVAVRGPDPLPPSAAEVVAEAACPPDALRPASERQSFYARAVVPPPAPAAEGSEHYLHARGRFLASLLLDGPASPMHRRLVDAGLGTGYCPSAGLSTTGPPLHTFGVRGMRRGDEARVDAAVLAALEEGADRGFDARRADGLLHQLELSLKHRTADFGLVFCGAVAGAWGMRRDVIDAVEVGPKLERLRAEGSDGDLLRRLVRDELLEPSLRGGGGVARLAMHPDAAFEERAAAEERAFVAARAAAMTEGDKAALRAQSAELAAAQAAAATQDVSCLPSLDRADIPRVIVPDARATEVLRLRAGGAAPLQVVEADVADLVYLRLKVDLAAADPADWRWLHLLPAFLRSLGTARLGHDEFATEAQQCARVLTFGLACVPNPSDPRAAPELALTASVSCLADRADRAAALLAEALTSTRWGNTAHAATLIAAAAEGMSSNLANDGHGVAAAFAGRHLSPAAWFGHASSGLPMVPHLHDLAQRGEEGAREATAACARILCSSLRQPAAGVDPLAAELPSLAWAWPAALVGDDAAATAAAAGGRPLLPTFDSRRAGFTARVVASAACVGRGCDAVAAIADAVFSGREEAAPGRDVAAPWRRALASEDPAFGVGAGAGAGAPARERTGLVAPLPVSYGGWAAPTGVGTAHADSPALALFGDLLSSLLLHRRVREEGGAYGAGASHGDGAFSQWSFYDPNVQSTAAVFDEALAWARRREFSERDVQEALLSVFGQVDAPSPPAAAGSLEFTHGITDAMRQERRERFLAASRDGIAEAVERHLGGAMPRARTAFVVPSEEAVPEGWSSLAI